MNIYYSTQQPSFRSQSLWLMILGGGLMLYQSPTLELLGPIQNSVKSRKRWGKRMWLMGKRLIPYRVSGLPKLVPPSTAPAYWNNFLALPATTPPYPYETRKKETYTCLQSNRHSGPKLSAWWYLSECWCCKSPPLLNFLGLYSTSPALVDGVWLLGLWGGVKEEFIPTYYPGPSKTSKWSSFRWKYCDVDKSLSDALCTHNDV